jgi:hypothetical protein
VLGPGAHRFVAGNKKGSCGVGRGTPSLRVLCTSDGEGMLGTFVVRRGLRSGVGTADSSFFALLRRRNDKGYSGFLILFAQASE